MDCVKVAMRSRGMKVEAGRQYVEESKDWRAMAHMKKI